MEAQERADQIVRGFYEELPTKVAVRFATETVAAHILTAQREAIECYQANIRAYGDEIPAARQVCDRLMQLGEATLDQYE